MRFKPLIVNHAGHRKGLTAQGAVRPSLRNQGPPWAVRPSSGDVPWALFPWPLGPSDPRLRIRILWARGAVERSRGEVLSGRWARRFRRGGSPQPAKSEFRDGRWCPRSMRPFGPWFRNGVLAKAPHAFRKAAWLVGNASTGTRRTERTLMTPRSVGGILSADDLA